MDVRAVTKTLSPNDAGVTGGHQAGILVPKGLTSFFPPLDAAGVNPYVWLCCTDPEQHEWMFKFIHYNNRLRGGTRDEYRLTHITRYLKYHRLGAGDRIKLVRTSPSAYRIENGHHYAGDTDSVLRLGSGWKVISI